MFNSLSVSLLLLLAFTRSIQAHDQDRVKVYQDFQANRVNGKYNEAFDAAKDKYSITTLPRLHPPPHRPTLVSLMISSDSETATFTSKASPEKNRRTSENRHLDVEADRAPAHPQEPPIRTRRDAVPDLNDNIDFRKLRYDKNYARQHLLGKNGIPKSPLLHSFSPEPQFITLARPQRMGYPIPAAVVHLLASEDDEEDRKGIGSVNVDSGRAEMTIAADEASQHTSMVGYEDQIASRNQFGIWGLMLRVFCPDRRDDANDHNHNYEEHGRTSRNSRLQREQEMNIADTYEEETGSTGTPPPGNTENLGRDKSEPVHASSTATKNQFFHVRHRPHIPHPAAGNGRQDARRYRHLEEKEQEKQRSKSESKGNVPPDPAAPNSPSAQSQQHQAPSPPCHSPALPSPTLHPVLQDWKSFASQWDVLLAQRRCLQFGFGCQNAFRYNKVADRDAAEHKRRMWRGANSARRRAGSGMLTGGGAKGKEEEFGYGNKKGMYWDLGVRGPRERTSPQDINEAMRQLIEDAEMMKDKSRAATEDGEDFPFKSEIKRNTRSGHGEDDLGVFTPEMLSDGDKAASKQNKKTTEHDRNDEEDGKDFSKSLNHRRKHEEARLDSNSNRSSNSSSGFGSHSSESEDPSPRRSQSLSLEPSDEEPVSNSAPAGVSIDQQRAKTVTAIVKEVVEERREVPIMKGRSRAQIVVIRRRRLGWDSFPRHHH